MTIATADRVRSNATRIWRVKGSPSSTTALETPTTGMIKVLMVD
jgi:hypothetical protein